MTAFWPWAPAHEVTETLAWATSLQEAESDAQRVAQRLVPFRTLTGRHRFALPGSGVPLPGLDAMDTLLREIGAGPVELPDWPETVAVGDLGAGAIALTFDTAHGAWEAGARIALRGRRDAAVVATPTVSAVRADGLDLSTPLTAAIPDALAAPIRTGRLAGPGGASAGAAVVEVTQAFEVIGGPAIAPPGGLLLEGLDVFEGPVLAAGPVQMGWDRPAEVISGPAGPVVAEARHDWHEARSEIRVLDRGPAARRARRGWLYARRGRQKAFWAPTLRPGLALASGLGAADEAVQIAMPPAPDLLVGRGILLSEGGVSVARLLGAWSPVSADVASYAITAPGAAFSTAAAASELRVHRLDADRIELRHIGLDLTELAAPIVERPA